MYKAMMFAYTMIRGGEDVSKAVKVSADYYKQDPREVRKYVINKLSK